MFSQLVKHEFKATRRLIPFIYLVTVLIILSNLAVRQLHMDWLSGMLLVLLILLGIGEVMMTYVVVFYRYYKNLYNSEGYLTHTLPVPPRQLLTSKILVSFIWLLISYLVMFAVVLTVILLKAEEYDQGLVQVLELVVQSTGLNQASVYWIAGLIFAYACLAILFLMAQIFFAITLGNCSRFHHLGLGGPIVSYLGVYFVSQIAILIGLIAVPLGLTVEDHVLKVVPRGMAAAFFNGQDFVIGLGSIVVIIALTVGLFTWTARLLKNHTSLR